MYVQVVVPIYRGPNEDGFTYEVPKGLKVQPGQLVLVPFGRVREIGITTETREQRLETSIQIKPIDSVVFERPFLLQYQLELLGWMAKYYLAGTGNCANAILPALPSSKLLIVNGKWKSPESIHHSPFTIHQTLVLVPTINNIPQTMALFPKAARPVVFHSELKPQEKLEAWLKVLGGQADYVFGTRQAVFLPYPKLRKIILINEHDDSYKDQRSPYYDTLTVAEKVSQLTKAKIEVIDPAPRITAYFQFNKIATSFDSLRSLRTRNDKVLKIVSMADERKVGNKTAISDELKYQIEENLKNAGNTLLFLNKKKESGTLYCNNCKYQEALPKEPEKCPSCGSEQIFFASLNINSLAKQVQKLFPKTKVNLISDGTRDQRLETRDQKAGIDIATSAVFYKLLPKHYNLVAAISADSALNVPQYSAPEKAYVLITTLKRLAQKTLVLQTYNPENPTLISAANSNYEEFYREQLEQRRALLYPPFSILVKLVVKGKNEEKTLSKAEDLAEAIRDQLPETRDQESGSILGPFESYFRKTSKVYNIVIKIPLKTYTLADREKAIGSISSALQEAKAARVADQIVVEPASLN